MANYNYVRSSIFISFERKWKKNKEKKSDSEELEEQKNIYSQRKKLCKLLRTNNLTRMLHRTHDTQYYLQLYFVQDGYQKKEYCKNGEIPCCNQH